ncbi:MAG TPA: 2-oxoglutarate and iron-dependent oxygenase domain-containing protein [Caulobacteraceae bacterium]|jgi:isopenicillin N synthase-like dioxygenase|nr:2-oxoglutarate and iron-dependent oxygenase domain-containing protein [Caulobacteraceae bacterium]
MSVTQSQTSIAPVSFRLNAADPATFATALGASFERHGFAVVADHGIGEDLSAKMLRDAKTFFALPEATKASYRVPGGAGQRGYTPFAVETAKDAAHPDLKEFWHVGREMAGRRGPLLDNLWPAELPAFRGDAVALYEAFEALGGEFLAAIGVFLDLEPGFLEDSVRGGDSVLRLLHYPASDFTGPAVRAGPHEDINAITLLLGAEEAGLELLNRDGSWLPVNPPPGAVVVNIGDMLARLTNDVLPSTTHRVVNPTPARRGVARYSMPFFLHFRSDFLIRTLAQCVSAECPDRYPKPITAGDFLKQRLREIRLA